MTGARSRIRTAASALLAVAVVVACGGPAPTRVPATPASQLFGGQVPGLSVSSSVEVLALP